MQSGAAGSQKLNASSAMFHHSFVFLLFFLASVVLWLDFHFFPVFPFATNISSCSKTVSTVPLFLCNFDLKHAILIDYSCRFSHAHFGKILRLPSALGTVQVEPATRKREILKILLLCVPAFYCFACACKSRSHWVVGGEWSHMDAQRRSQTRTVAAGRRTERAPWTPVDAHGRCESVPQYVHRPSKPAFMERSPATTEVGYELERLVIPQAIPTIR
jgi:hypothetical protein